MAFEISIKGQCHEAAHDESLPAIEQTVSAVQTRVVRIHGGESALQSVRIRAVVDAMGPCIRDLSLNTVREPAIQIRLQRMVRRVGARLGAIVRAEGRIESRIGRDAERPQRRENRPAVRACGLNRRVLVTLIEKMNAARADVSDCQDGSVDDLPLDIDIPLHLIRRGRRVVVHRVALRRQRSDKRRSRECREHLNREAVRRIEVIPGRVRARRDGIVENAEAAADRSLVIAKWIVSETKARIEVPQRWIVKEYIRNLRERLCGSIVNDRIQRVLVCGWIGHELITKSEIQSKVLPNFPIVLEVGVEVRLAEITVTVTLLGQRSEE